MGIIRKVIKSFTFAVAGVIKTFKSEFMFRVYVCLYILVVALVNVVGMSVQMQLFLYACWSGVLAFELINTALEKAIDAMHQKSDLTCFAKDAAAGCVALFAVTSGIVTLVSLYIEITGGGQ